MTAVERPILYTGAMVRARRAGRKTMTRRVVTPQPPHSCRYEMNGNGNKALCLAGHGASMLFVPPRGSSADTFIRCPYGVVGDRLWTKETYRADVRFDDRKPLDIPEGERIWYEADGPAPEWAGRIRQSIFMRRWMSRGLDELVEVRVERVRQISDGDAEREGIECAPVHVRDVDEWGCRDGGRSHHWSCRKPFRELWDSINAARGYGWVANPFVWVLSFRVLEGAVRAA